MSRADRPGLGALNVGDTLIMRSGTPGRRDGQTDTAVRVVTVGRKYVHVVLAEYYERYIAATPEARSWRWSTRRFLLADQKEGAPGDRVGYSASIATAEQHAYDREHVAADAYLRSEGVDLRRSSPWFGREVELAGLLKAYRGETGSSDA